MEQFIYFQYIHITHYTQTKVQTLFESIHCKNYDIFKKSQQKYLSRWEDPLKILNFNLSNERVRRIFPLLNKARWLSFELYHWWLFLKRSYFLQCIWIPTPWLLNVYLCPYLHQNGHANNRQIVEVNFGFTRNWWK